MAAGAKGSTSDTVKKKEEGREKEKKKKKSQPELGEWGEWGDTSVVLLFFSFFYSLCVSSFFHSFYKLGQGPRGVFELLALYFSRCRGIVTHTYLLPAQQD